MLDQKHYYIFSIYSSLLKIAKISKNARINDCIESKVINI